MSPWTQWTPTFAQIQKQLSSNLQSFILVFATVGLLLRAFLGHHVLTEEATQVCRARGDKATLLTTLS